MQVHSQPAAAKLALLIKRTRAVGNRQCDLWLTKHSYRRYLKCLAPTSALLLTLCFRAHAANLAISSCCTAAGAGHGSSHARTSLSYDAAPPAATPAAAMVAEPFFNAAPAPQQACQHGL